MLKFGVTGLVAQSEVDRVLLCSWNNHFLRLAMMLWCPNMVGVQSWKFHQRVDGVVSVVSSSTKSRLFSHILSSLIQISPFAHI